METVGIIGGILFFIKVFIHIGLYIYHKDKDSLMSLGIRTNFMVFLPLFKEDVPPRLQWFKTVVNIIYSIAVLMLVAFLIDHNTK